MVRSSRARQRSKPSRECREELVITVVIVDVFAEVTHVYPNLTVHITLVNARTAEGEPHLLEHNGLRWITPSEIDGYSFYPADEAIPKEIKERACCHYPRKNISRKKGRRWRPFFVLLQRLIFQPMRSDVLAQILLQRRVKRHLHVLKQFVIYESVHLVVRGDGWINVIINAWCIGAQGLAVGIMQFEVSGVDV